LQGGHISLPDYSLTLNDFIKEALDLAGAMQCDSEALLLSADRFMVEFFRIASPLLPSTASCIYLFL
jgi:hypothetical protein